MQSSVESLATIHRALMPPRNSDICTYAHIPHWQPLDGSYLCKGQGMAVDREGQSIRDDGGGSSCPCSRLCEPRPRTCLHQRISCVWQWRLNVAPCVRTCECHVKKRIHSFQFKRCLVEPFGGLGVVYVILVLLSSKLKQSTPHEVLNGHLCS